MSSSTPSGAARKTINLPWDFVSKYSPSGGAAQITDSPHSLFFRAGPEVSNNTCQFLNSRGWINLSYAQLHPSDYPTHLPINIVDQLALFMNSKFGPLRTVQLVKQLRIQMTKEIELFLAAHTDPVTGVKPVLTTQRPDHVMRNQAYYKAVPAIWNLWLEDSGFNILVTPMLRSTRGWNHLYTTASIFRKDGLQNAMQSYLQSFGPAFEQVIPRGWVLPSQKDEWNRYILQVIIKHQGDLSNVTFESRHVKDVLRISDHNTLIDTNTVEIEPAEDVDNFDDDKPSNKANASTIQSTSNIGEQSTESSSSIHISLSQDGLIQCTLPQAVLQKCAWIAKPSGGSRGEGIFPFNDLTRLNDRITTIIEKKKQFASDIKASEIGRAIQQNAFKSKHRLFTGTYTVQEFINTNMLIGTPKYKYDLRLYVLVTSFYPLEIYIHKLGFARLASTPFDEDINAVSSHLTNFSLGKQNTKKGKTAAATPSPPTTTTSTTSSSEPVEGQPTQPETDTSQHSLNNEQVKSGDENPTQNQNVVSESLRRDRSYDNLECDMFNPSTDRSNGLKWTMQEFRDYIDQRKTECDTLGLPMKDWSTIWLEIKHLALKAILPAVTTQCYGPKIEPQNTNGQDTVIMSQLATPDKTKQTVWETLMSSCLSDYNPQYRGFELLGIDIMLLNDGSPQLIEMNRSPAMMVSTKADLAKTQMLHDTFNLLRIEPSILAAKRAQWVGEQIKESKLAAQANLAAAAATASAAASSTIETAEQTETASSGDSSAEQTSSTSNGDDEQSNILTSNGKSLSSLLSAAGVGSVSSTTTTTATTTTDSTAATTSAPSSSDTASSIASLVTSLETAETERRLEPVPLEIHGVKIDYALSVKATSNWMYYRPELVNLIEQCPLPDDDDDDDDDADEAASTSKKASNLWTRVNSLSADVVNEYMYTAHDAFGNEFTKKTLLQQRKRIPVDTTSASDDSYRCQSLLTRQKPIDRPFCRPHQYQRISSFSFLNYIANSDQIIDQISSQLFQREDELYQIIANSITSVYDKLSNDMQQYVQTYMSLQYGIQHVEILAEQFCLQYFLNDDQFQQYIALFIPAFIQVTKLPAISSFSNISTPTSVLKFSPSCLQALQSELQTTNSQQSLVFNPSHDQTLTSDPGYMTLCAILRAQISSLQLAQYWFNAGSTSNQSTLASLKSESLLALAQTAQPHELQNHLAELSTFFSRPLETPTNPKLIATRIQRFKAYDNRIEKRITTVSQYMYAFALFSCWVHKQQTYDQ